jgi:hypothetical protein
MERVLRLRGGGLRRLDPRLESSPDRCGKNLLEYAARIFERLGLFDAEVRIKLAHALPGPVSFDTESAFPHTARNAPAAPPAKLVRRGTGEPRFPDEIKWLLYLRFRRLLRHNRLAFGSIVFTLRGGRIEKLSLTNDIRPAYDDSSGTAEMFFGVPRSEPWSLGFWI